MPQEDRILLRSSSTEDMRPDMGIVLGRALSMDYRTVVVARDLMRSSAMMKEALVAGLLSAGVDVMDLGVTSCPALGLSASKGDCAVYVTEYRGYGMTSGYLLINPDGSLFRKEQIRHLEKVFIDPPEPPESGNLGHVLRHHGAEEEYIRRIGELVPDGSGCSVVLDCGCGPCSTPASRTLNSMGVAVLSVNAQDDPDYVVDDMDEVGLSTTAVSMLVESNPGFIGISMNKIGTMLALLDENGETLTPEQVFTIIVMYLRPASIAVPMDTSSLVRDALEGRLDSLLEGPGRDAPSETSMIMTEMSVGAVCREVAAGAELGYYDGGIIFGNTSVMPDGIMAAAVITGLAGSNSLNHIANGLPVCHRDSATLACECSPESFIRALEDSLEDLDGDVLSKRDAWRVDLDSGWFLVRLVKGPEPRVEITGESRDRAYLIGLMEMVEGMVRSCMRGQ